MTTSQPRRLDVAALARQAGQLSGQSRLVEFERLARESNAPEADPPVRWSVQGEHRSAVDGILRPALHLHAEAGLTLTCQRCLGQVEVPLQVDRHFIFAPDEETAAALDDASEDDVLALAPDFDLQALIEDELLLALPLVPRHEQCPEPVRLSDEDPAFQAALDEKVHPFAALAALKSGKSH